VPEPGRGQKTVKSNDVYRADNGLLYLIDRLDGIRNFGKRGVRNFARERCFLIARTANADDRHPTYHSAGFDYGVVVF